MNKILFHYLLSFVINILVMVCFLNISQLMNGGEPVSVIVIINSVYKFFIHSLFCGVESRNYFTMRIIAYSCLALLT